MTRTNQILQTIYWFRAREKNLTADELLVESYLMLCPECGASGMFRMSIEDIAALIPLSFSKIKKALEGLQKKERVYSEKYNWLFIRGKWEFEYKGSKMISCIQKEVSIAPPGFQILFNKIYPDILTDIETVITNTAYDGVSELHNGNGIEIGNGVGIEDAKPKKHFHGEKVQLTDDEYKKLCDGYGKKATDKKISDMNGYLVAKGKSYANYRQAIQNWFTKDEIFPVAEIKQDLWQCPRCGTKYITDIGACNAGDCPAVKVVKLEQTATASG